MRIAVTRGDPAGIGPEVVDKALRDPRVRDRAEFAVIGGPAGKVAPGVASAEAGAAAVAAVALAADMAMAGEVDAVVTAPIHKHAAALAGFPYPGHTEYFARRAGDVPVAMMMVGGGLRVTLATIHLALAEVAGTLSREGLLGKLRLTRDALTRDFDVESPRVAVAGLNPHAGEAGRFGDEEQDVIAPAVEAARAEGIDAQGPLPGDSVFQRAREGQFDAVLAMYHDQGTIPVKLLGFHDGVNVTIGLPFVRTSPDHGTAFEIAGRGVADPGSMVAAVRTAIDHVRCRRARRGGPTVL
ncbi:MAG: 4-hydroxythreonine-4-phosphate dehydrogenase PdxA [Planctomycetes bacterium]|nr:4-hydroxythreonine-4-phosphate dehydrogenase PdxA [Planctomycetota bacterium]